MTWPPTVPARPHPSTEVRSALGSRKLANWLTQTAPAPWQLHAPYGLGDWFIASLVSSVVSWPVAFAVDSLWGSVLLPQVQSIRQGRWVQEAEAASLVPKAFGSYLGAHLFVPRAWWVYKLTLLPALPLSFGISLAIYFATTDGGARREAVDAYAGPEVPFSAPTSLDIGSTAWRASTQNDKSSATRLREAAPTAVQFALQQAGL